MNTDAVYSDPCYSVCFLSHLLGNPDAICFPISVTQNADVQDLALKIRDEPDIRSELEAKKLCLFKVKLLCGEVSTVPDDKIYNSTVEWLSKHATDKRLRMQSVFRLEKYFPDGPAPEEKYLIDVIAVSDPTLQALFRSSIPKNETFTISESTPRKPKEETEGLVEEFLSRYDTKLRQYLAGPPWKEFWDAPPDASNNIAQFVKSLKIPDIGGNPVLLLHNLGDGVVDSSVVDDVFTRKSSFLVNTSGSGKTRLLFEGLTRHWGFYFTTIVDSINHHLGSADISQATETHIPGSRGFIPNPWTLADENQHAAFYNNHLIAERRVIQILTARICFFNYFLRMARGAVPDESVDNYKKHWLFLQLCSVHILGEDVFKKLTETLMDASDEFLLKERLAAHARLTELQIEFSLGKDFFLVLDEAQVAIDRLENSFCSQHKQAIKRPVLRPIIRTWQMATSFPIVISGTSLSIDVVNEVVSAAVMKIMPFTFATRTGAFDDEDDQREYILRYMPRHFARTISGKAFLKRAWNYARGRHRFTAALVTQSLKFSFQSSHRILNAFIEASCGFVPSDAQRFVREEQEIVNIKGKLDPFASLDFSKLFDDPVRLLDFSNVLYAWILLRKPIALTSKSKDLVELGFARFIDIPGEDAYVDEPIVLLAAASQFGSRDFSLGDYVKRPLLVGPGRGEHFEASVAYYLACAFADTSKLCDIFDFGDGVPEWATLPAELVSVALKGKGIEANRFHLQDLIDSTTAIGVHVDSVEEMMKWLKNPSSLLCFPNKTMGPDVIFFVRLDGRLILPVLVQCKWSTANTLDKMTLQRAVYSLDLSRLFKLWIPPISKADAARKCALDLFKRLNGPHILKKPDKWLQDGLALSVIASYPAVTPEASVAPFYATLDLDRCIQMVDEKDFLAAIPDSLGIDRNTEGDGVGTSRKRRRTLSGGCGRYGKKRSTAKQTTASGKKPHTASGKKQSQSSASGKKRR
ncbi:hypothetical protein ACEPAI_3167 [Sanghuangporus weigelae]